MTPREAKELGLIPLTDPHAAHEMQMARTTKRQLEEQGIRAELVETYKGVEVWRARPVPKPEQRRKLERYHLLGK